MKKLLFIAAAIAMLSGCGDSSGSGSSGGSEPQKDAFTSEVLNMASTAADSSAPISVDALTATAPEDTYPMPII